MRGIGLWMFSFDQSCLKCLRTKEIDDNITVCRRVCSKTDDIRSFQDNRLVISFILYTQGPAVCGM